MTALVVLCSHNGERFVREQIASIRQQSKPVDAIHAFDFGSTDATRKILGELAQDGQTPPVHVQTYPDAPGASISFFRAFTTIAAISSPEDCIFFADQDDVWLKTKAEKMRQRFNAELAQQTNAVVAVFHDVSIVDAQLRTLSDTYYTGNPFSIPRDLASDRLLLSNPVVGHTIAASGALLRMVTSYLQRDAYCMHDWAVILVASRIGRIGYEPATLSLYRQHDSNVLGAFRRRRPFEIVGRTLRFARKVTRQAVTFERDIGRILQDPSMNSLHNSPPTIDRCLGPVVRHFPWLSQLFLAGVALVRGPTWQRRALSVAILVSAVTAPFSRGSRT